MFTPEQPVNKKNVPPLLLLQADGAGNASALVHMFDFVDLEDIVNAFNEDPSDSRVSLVKAEGALDALHLSSASVSSDGTAYIVAARNIHTVFAFEVCRPSNDRN